MTDSIVDGNPLGSHSPVKVRCIRMYASWQRHMSTTVKCRPIAGVVCGWQGG